MLIVNSSSLRMWENFSDKTVTKLQTYVKDEKWTRSSFIFLIFYLIFYFFLEREGAEGEKRESEAGSMPSVEPAVGSVPQR